MHITYFLRSQVIDIAGDLILRMQKILLEATPRAQASRLLQEVKAQFFVSKVGASKT